MVCDARRAAVPLNVCRRATGVKLLLSATQPAKTYASDGELAVDVADDTPRHLWVCADDAQEVLEECG